MNWLLDQDAVNSYVFKLAPNTAGVEYAPSAPLNWGAAFPAPAHSRNKFYRAVSFSRVKLHQFTLSTTIRSFACGL